MPAALTLSPRRPALRTHAASLAQRLRALATTLAPELRTVWRRIFRDAKGLVDLPALRKALAQGNAILAEEVLATAWHAASGGTAPGVLHDLVAQGMVEVAAEIGPTLAKALDIVATVEVTFNVVVPEAVALIDGYVGTEIRSISDTTLAGVRSIVRQSFEEGLPLTKQMDALKSLVGLTPGQHASLVRLRARLAEQGLSPAAIDVQVASAATRALNLRVEAIARTESMRIANMGNYAILTQQAQDGLLDVSRTRRFWLLGPRPCPARCAPVPGMNAQGVGLYEAFSTPVGAALYPPLHPMCLCTTDIRII